MSLFQGDFNTGRVQNHIFSSENKEMEALGLGSFTKDSFHRIWNNNLKIIKTATANDALSEVAEGQTLFSQAGGLSIESDGEFVIYDKEAQTFSTGAKTYEDWEKIISYYESKTLDSSIASNNIYDQTIKAVKTSLHNGVLFTFEAKDIAASLSGNITYKLKFLDRKWSEDKDKDIRTAGISAAVPIVNVAETAAGTQYSKRETQLGLDVSSVGKKSSVLQGDIKNPRNTVAAQQDLYLNEGTGKFESGPRRILAMLLSDIDAAQLNNITLGPSDLNNLSPSDFTDKTSNLFTLYTPPTGLAVPLNVQNNNQNIFSPNFVKKCVKDQDGNYISSGYLPESVIVTNRFNKVFKKGTTVFLTRIGKEWIPEEQIQEPLSSVLKLGQWTFSKLIAGSDFYFKDHRFYRSDTNKISISPSTYENNVRYTFFYNIDLPSEYTDLYFPKITIDDEEKGLEEFNETEKVDLVASTQYLISTIFDQLHEDAGGFQPEKSWISRTNINKGDTFSDSKYATELGVFWGPVFPDGYKNIIFDPVPTNPDSSGKYFNNDKATANIVNLLSPSSGLTQPNKTVDGVAKYIPTIHDVPAECTSKILDCTNLIEKDYEVGEIPNSSIIPRIILPPYEKSVKVSTNNIQFIPLTANLVGSSDKNAKAAFSQYERNFYDRMQEFFKSAFNNESPLNNDIWGNMFERSDSFYLSYEDYDTLSCSPINGFQIDKSAEPLVPYDCYTKRDQLDPTLGYPVGMFDDPGLKTGANCVGIICGKNTFSKKNGGTVNITTTSNYGLPPFSQIAPGSSFVGIVLGVPLIESNGVRSLPVRPQFGSKVDEIHSFGTDALFVRIFDYWPDELTIFDPRYFGIVHFNPGNWGSIPSSGEYNDNGTIRNVYNLETSVDFRIPTWNHLSDEGDNEIISPSTIIDSGNAGKIRPKDRWRVNPIRRGMCLTNGGFTYLAHKIGIFNDGISIKTDPKYVDVITGEESSKTFSGKKYTNGEIVPIRNGLEIQLNTDAEGSITTISIALDTNGNEKNGEFLHTDFPFEFKLPLPKDSSGMPLPGAESAILIISKGKVYLSINTDLPPKEHVGLTRISAPSKSGTSEIINEVITSEFTLDKNTTGKYDIFVHFHNDITHTVFYTPLGGISTLQYINMNIS